VQEKVLSMQVLSDAMRVGGIHYRTVWMEDQTVLMIDQNSLPFVFSVYESRDFEATCKAIEDMKVRGAGAIGATAGYAMAQAALQATGDYTAFLQKARRRIEHTRPTAQNLFSAAGRVYDAALGSKELAFAEAQKIADEDALACQKIGEAGNSLIEQGSRILTHCNAGWLAFVDYGSALAPIYSAHRQGKVGFVYVDETRPRGQGARLTAWELENEQVPHAIIADNAAAHLMAEGMVDLVIVGADRIASNGDVANKIGTLGLAIAAKEYKIPFYVAAPAATFDAGIDSGKDIPIEQRDPEEVLFQTGLTRDGNLERVLVASPGAQALNPAFDVTPSRLIEGIITEKGVIRADREAIAKHLGLQEILYSGIKFRCRLKKEQPPEAEGLEELKHWSRYFHEQGLAPPYKGGSSGNLSFRTQGTEFIITASSTSLAELASENYVKVTSANLETCELEAAGQKLPSSEAMLHYAVYQALPHVNAVFHGHYKPLLCLGGNLGIPETQTEAPYGTLELVRQVQAILGQNPSAFILKNHGFVALGKTIKQAGMTTISLLRGIEAIGHFG
jgi:methylthioribose-1-phosphate isomerase